MLEQIIKTMNENKPAELKIHCLTNTVPETDLRFKSQEKYSDKESFIVKNPSYNSRDC